VTINGVNIPLNSSSWKEYSTNVVLAASAKININTNGLFIDELRMHPLSAHLKTFTYDPLIGMKSVSDASNLPVNYKYDDFIRLQSLRDSKGNLLKLFSYNLKGYTGPSVGSSLNADFSFSGSLNSGGTINFTAANADAGIQYDWDFGDGEASLNSTKSINHTYTVGGAYLVKLTVRKGTMQNFSQQSILISIPTLPAPLVSINSTTFNIGGLPLVRTLMVNASSVQSGGVTPYRNYVWQVIDQNGAYIPNQWITTTPSATLTFSVPALSPQNCVPSQYNYSVRCRVVDTSNATSLWGSGIATYTLPRVLDVSPSSISANYNQAPSTLTVTNSDSNISVTSNVSWISVSNIDQCGSFTLDFQLYTGTATSRVGTVTVSSSNGSKTVNVTQYKSGI
jgi:PKD domain